MPAPIRLAGGIPAFNEERHIAAATRSLLDQRMPEGVEWTGVWVVTSGCTDRTPEIVRALMNDDPRIRLVDEAERRGKSSALASLLRVVRGTHLVLLNGDAVAEPGALRALLNAAPVDSGSRPFAVMGHPVPPARRVPLDEANDLLWEVHHRLHEEVLTTDLGSLLSDELLLLPLDPTPPFRRGIVNDGAFLADWVRASGGRLVYAPDARVRVETPHRLADLVRQRRRILGGHHQVATLSGQEPATLRVILRRQPRTAVRLLARVLRERRPSFSALIAVGAAEAAATVLASADRLSRRDQSVWERIAA